MSKVRPSQKNKFRLFQGLRDKTEDEEIYHKVYELCFDEIVSFSEENLSPKELEELTLELEKLDSNDNQNEAVQVMSKAIAKIPDHSFKLYHRLEYFVDQLLINTLRNKSKN